MQLSLNHLNKPLGRICKHQVKISALLIWSFCRLVRWLCIKACPPPPPPPHPIHAPPFLANKLAIIDVSSTQKWLQDSPLYLDSILQMTSWLKAKDVRMILQHQLWEQSGHFFSISLTLNILNQPCLMGSMGGGCFALWFEHSWPSPQLHHTLTILTQFHTRSDRGDDAAW